MTYSVTPSGSGTSIKQDGVEVASINTAGEWTFAQKVRVPAQSMVRLHTDNGYGSTNNKIRRWTTAVVSQGTDITYADSATLGASFTINTDGVYAISYSDCMTSAYMGISLNTTQPTTAIQSITEANKLSTALCVGTNGTGFVSWSGYLASGSVVRGHTDGTATGANATQQFTITRVA